MNIDLNKYGWDDMYQSEWDKVSTEDMIKARVISDYGQKLRVITGTGEMLIDRPYKKEYDSFSVTVGDWTGIRKEQDFLKLEIVLKRKTKFSRAAAGLETKEQVLAANIETVFIMQSLNKDFNLKRLERYLIATWESGALPVVVLTKSDACDDVESYISDVNNISPGVDIHAISCIAGDGLSETKSYFRKGETVALLGSSGVGKSTYINTIAGMELLKTQDIREDDSKGRHTTTHREIILLPDGGLVLDNPGMRELSLWEAGEGIDILYGDIEELIGKCRFYDCTHSNEPGCSVREALEDGTLKESRWQNWLKLCKELEHIEAKKEGKLRQKQKEWGKQLARYQKEIKKKNQKY
jgi:ribosome biogenesis GTPase